MPADRGHPYVVVVSGLVLWVLLGGCGSTPPGQPRTRAKALDGALQMMYAVRERVRDGHYDVAMERSGDVTRRLADSRLDDLAEVSALRKDWGELQADLSPAPPADLTARLDGLIRRLEAIVSANPAEESEQP
jgi:hypothetical protein